MLAATSLVLGCATTSTTSTRKDRAVAAGFKVVKPTTPDQKALLDTLPADKFTRITHSGKSCYVLPDRAGGQAYVGSPDQFQSYQEDSRAREEVAEYQQATSGRASQTGEENANPGSGLLEEWDWSSSDGQTD